MSLLVGVHVSRKSKVLDDKKEQELHDAITTHIHALKCTAIQIFTHGPPSFRPNQIDIAEVKDAAAKINLTVHSPYPTVSLWNLDPDDLKSAKSMRVINAIMHQFEVAHAIGAWGVVVHITLHPPEVIAKLTRRVLHPIARKYGVTPLLEMVANRAHVTDTYETPEKLNRLSKLIGGNYYGWTIDTAHLWGAGVDCSEYEVMRMWLQGVTHGMIKQFHLNGSSARLGSGADKHEIPFCEDDLVYHKFRSAPKKSGAYAIVEYAITHDIPIICEINRGSESDSKWCLRMLRTLARACGHTTVSVHSTATGLSMD